MKIRLNRTLSKNKAKLFALCNFNIGKMSIIFVGIFFAEQAISVALETLITGGNFKHWFDSVFLLMVVYGYFYYANALGEFLLDLHLNAEVEK